MTNETTEKVFNFIRLSDDRPSLADIARGCGLASRSVALYNVRKLAEAGRIIFVSGTHRSIRMPEASNG